MRRAWVLPVEGPLRAVDLDEEGAGGSLRVMQQAVGGLIQPVDDCPEPNVTMYVNEEGMFGEKPNMRAYDVALTHPAVGFQGMVFGDVIFVAFEPMAGDHGHLERPPRKVEIVVGEALA